LAASAEEAASPRCQQLKTAPMQIALVGRSRQARRREQKPEVCLLIDTKEDRTQTSNKVASHCSVVAVACVKMTLLAVFKPFAKDRSQNGSNFRGFWALFVANVN
jgi:hypothetical protein